MWLSLEDKMAPITKEQEDQFYEELYGSPEVQELIARDFDRWVNAMEAEHQDFPANEQIFSQTA